MSLEALVIDMSSEPEDITTEEFRQLADTLLENVNQGLKDPLLGLDAATETNLIRLAYHNVGNNLDRLERTIRAALIERGDGETAARRFTFKSARDSAKAWKKDLATTKGIRHRNGLRVYDGDKALLERVGDETNDDIVAKLASDVPLILAIGILEKERPGRIYFDTFANNFFTDWDGTDNDAVVKVKPIDDEMLLRIYTWLLQRNRELGKGLSEGASKNAVHHVGYDNQRSAPQEWLTSIEWDGVPRVDSWLSEAYGVANDDYHKDAGRIWMLSMAARIMKPGEKVDTMPVLIGPQGNGKSTSLSILGGAWYAAINISVDKQDFLMSLSGLLVAEIAELDAISKAADTRVKALLSTALDKYRPPYGRVMKEYPRTAIPVGTTNDKGWHKDPTGGRRYLPIETTRQVNLDWLKENRDQLFAEALCRYKAGEDWHKLDRTEQERRVAEHAAEEPWLEDIQRWLPGQKLYLGEHAGSDVECKFPDPTATDMEAYWGTLLTTSRIMKLCLELPPNMQNRVNANKIAQILRLHGFELKTVREPGAGREKLPKRAWCVTQSEYQLMIQDYDKPQ